MDVWSEIRRRVLAGELTRRQACREYRLNFRTIGKVVGNAEPPGYRQQKRRPRPRLEPVLPIIEQMLRDDEAAPPKQRHTARRIFCRLRDEHGYTGCSSTVRTAVRQLRQARRSAFVPLLHPPGEAQCDFGHATVMIAGARVKAAFLVMTLPHSGARFAAAYPRECSETFHAGHVAAFDFFGGVPRRIRYDNSRIAVVKLTGLHGRDLAPEFCRLQSHFLFDADFCAPRRGNEKGHVENGVGYVRRNFLVPMPAFASWEALNAHLADCCRRDQAHAIGRRTESIAALLPEDVAAFAPLPAEPFLARRLETVVINSLALGRFDGNDYSAPTRYAHQTLTAIGTVDRVTFRHQGEVVACHRRCWDKRRTIYNPLHYLALLERKTRALDSAAPLAGWELPANFATLRQRLEAADPDDGARQFIRVLRLCEDHELSQVAAAVERALTLEIVDADAVRLILERAAEVSTPSLDLSSRAHLGGVRVPLPNLSVYRELMPQGAAS